MTMHDAPAGTADDPMPIAPEPPGPNECCESGCEPCVHDLYTEALQEYRTALAAWQARQPAAGSQDA